MAELYKCDSCGKISPDENGLFLANNWVEVTVNRRKFKWLGSERPDHTYLFCEECFEGEDEQGTVKDFILKLRKLIFWWRA